MSPMTYRATMLALAMCYYLLDSAQPICTDSVDELGGYTRLPLASLIRSGRSETLGLVPFPRVGKRQGLVPFPRVGRSGLVPFPRVGRSGLVPFPRVGRSGLVPFPRVGKRFGSGQGFENLGFPVVGKRAISGTSAKWSGNQKTGKKNPAVGTADYFGQNKKFSQGRGLNSL